MKKSLTVRQYLERSETGFMKAHEALTDALFALVGAGGFQLVNIAERKPGLQDWRALAHQACEDEAAYLMLEAEGTPTDDVARKAVVSRYRAFLAEPALAASCHSMACH